MKYTLLKNKETGARSVRINATGEVITELANPSEYLKLRKKAESAYKRRAKNDLMESFGLTRVKGAVSGKTYWE